MPIQISSLPNTELIEAMPEVLALLEQHDDLGALCEHLNAAYRDGEALVSDGIYDQVFLAGLQEQQPDHHFLHSVEPESINPDLPLVRHITPMLSTLKAYGNAEVEGYVSRVKRAALDRGVAPTFVLTAKLDGVAADYSGTTLATRGDGLQGRDVTHIIEQGVVMHGGRGRGEIVVDQEVFESKLGLSSEHGLHHVRNFVAGYISSDSLKPHHLLALNEKALHFVPFDTLPSIEVDESTLIRSWESLYDQVVEGCPYLTDGVVVAVADPALREAMGSTNRHERGVLAIKKQGETAVTRVNSVSLSVGRTGRIVPTLVLEPVYLSNATISRATAHTVANLKKMELGVNAEVLICRSGEVIPRILKTITPADEPVTVTHCPVCNTPTVEDGEHTVCPNSITCSAQAEATLRHWFHTLGNVDGFGPETVSRLVEADLIELPAIYAMAEADFASLGFGPGQSKNLAAELERSRSEPVRDWRWLAAFGIRHLGRGDSRRLLENIPLENLDGITAEEIIAIDGFGPKTSHAIADTLNAMWPTIKVMIDLGFNLQSDADTQAEVANSPLNGKRMVFTGVMASAKRADLERGATELGAQVQSAVSASTDLLVIGEKAGSKLSKAQKLNADGKASIEILSEADYLEVLA